VSSEILGVLGGWGRVYFGNQAKTLTELLNRNYLVGCAVLPILHILLLYNEQDQEYQLFFPRFPTVVKP